MARSSTNTVDLYASIWPQLATASARQCSTCYGRDGTIASRSINRENIIEALVIFKQIQFALGSPKRYEFNSGAKKNERQWKSEQEHVPHFFHEKWKPGSFLDDSRCSHANQHQGNVQESVLQLDLLLFFCSSGQGHPTTVFCKISVRRSKFCLEFSFTWLKISRWPFHSCTIFEAHLILLINSLRFSEV